jgi:hypothetical protein
MANFPIPPRSLRRKLKYRLAAIQFVHFGKSLSACASEFDLTIQSICAVAAKDGWVEFQNDILSGKLVVGEAPAGRPLSERMKEMIDSDLVEFERLNSLGSVTVLQGRRKEILELIENCPLDMLGKLLGLLTAIRKEIEDCLLISEMRKALPRLLGEAVAGSDSDGDVIDVGSGLRE